MNLRHSCLIGCIMLTVSNGSLEAQPTSLIFDEISLDQGLSSYMIMSLERDAEGFLWIGTQNGLNRYDGARVHPFTAEVGFPGNIVESLEEYPRGSGVIWAGTRTQGLIRYSPIDAQFTSFTTDNADTTAISSNKISVLINDLDGTLWIGTHDAGLNRFNPASQSFERIKSRQNNELVGDSVTTVFNPASMRNTIWIGTTEGLSVLDKATGRFKNFTHDPTDYRSLSDNRITAIAEAGGYIWCSTYDGMLHRFDIETNQFDRLTSMMELFSVAHISVLAGSQQFEEILWIGTRGLGIIALNTRSLETHQYTYEVGVESSLSRADVLTLLEDDKGLLWVGTMSGVNKASFQGQRFKPVLHDPQSDNSLRVPAVFALYEPPSEPGIVWIGTDRGGLHRYDRQTERFSYFFTELDHPLSMVFAIHEDRYGQLWMGGNHPNLFLFDRSTQEVTVHPLAKETPTLVKQIYKAPSMPNVLWVATRGLGLVKFDPGQRAVLRSYRDDNSGLATNHVAAVLQMAQAPHVLWIATHDSDLGRLDMFTDSISVISQQANGMPCFPSGRLVSLASTSDGVLWVGTYDAGFTRYNPETGECRTYNVADGLAHAAVEAIFSDRLDRLWISTGNGLSLFDSRSATFTNFTEADGLQGNIFYFPARFQNAAGELFLGGENGFNIFHPDQIPISTVASKTVLTKVEVEGEPQQLQKTASGFGSIRLSFSKNDLTFEFAALDLHQPHKNQYQVWLDGAEAGWRHIGTRPFVHYPNQPPGTYTFHVKGSNHDGYWSEDIQIGVTILLPFWRQWWFWASITVLVLGLVVIAFLYRIYHIKQEEKTRQRIADDLHDDIGSKMSSIALDIERTSRFLRLEGEGLQRLEAVTDTAREVVDDLRDTVWMVDSEYDNLSDLVNRMKLIADTLLKGYRYQFYSPASMKDVHLNMEEKRHLFLFYKEALHNIVRHAHAESVEIQVGFEEQEISIEIRDDGEGFLTDAKYHGRGLSTMRKRVVEELQGEFKLLSAPGEGTFVSLKIRIA